MEKTMNLFVKFIYLYDDKQWLKKKTVKRAMLWSKQYMLNDHEAWLRQIISVRQKIEEALVELDCLWK